MSIMADKNTFKFDYISDYKVLSEGYCDPWVLPFGSDDDEPEYFVERGYEIKHNGHRSGTGSLFVRNYGRLKSMIQPARAKTNGTSKEILRHLNWLWPRSRNSPNKAM